ncbi:unnamed protein product [Protopolystoma xenopodis]|uniref:Uncharacterized protein n=1 Tax=Protopolystoma xenopodis TaxID=117903 RepID=A0A448WJV2_9PLAT|nr:unnamed protein product [Protopolystoma xenopodis]
MKSEPSANMTEDDEDSGNKTADSSDDKPLYNRATETFLSHSRLSGVKGLSDHTIQIPQQKFSMHFRHTSGLEISSKQPRRRVLLKKRTECDFASKVPAAADLDRDPNPSVDQLNCQFDTIKSTSRSPIRILRSRRILEAEIMRLGSVARRVSVVAESRQRRLEFTLAKLQQAEAETDRLRKLVVLLIIWNLKIV